MPCTGLPAHAVPRPGGRTRPTRASPSEAATCNVSGRAFTEYSCASSSSSQLCIQLALNFSAAGMPSHARLFTCKLTCGRWLSLYASLVRRSPYLWVPVGGGCMISCSCVSDANKAPTRGLVISAAAVCSTATPTRPLLEV